MTIRNHANIANSIFMEMIFLWSSETWITPFGAAGVEECFFTWRSGEAPSGTGQQTLVAATTCRTGRHGQFVSIAAI